MINPQRFMQNSLTVLNVMNTFFTIIVMYFIMMFSEQQGWSFLTTVSKLYLMTVLGAFAVIAIAITAFVFSSNIMMFAYKRR